MIDRRKFLLSSFSSLLMAGQSQRLLAHKSSSDKNYIMENSWKD